MHYGRSRSLSRYGRRRVRRPSGPPRRGEKGYTGLHGDPTRQHEWRAHWVLHADADADAADEGGIQVSRTYGHAIRRDT